MGLQHSSASFLVVGTAFCSFFSMKKAQLNKIQFNWKFIKSIFIKPASAVNVSSAIGFVFVCSTHLPLVWNLFKVKIAKSSSMKKKSSQQNYLRISDIFKIDVNVFDKVSRAEAFAIVEYFNLLQFPYMSQWLDPEDVRFALLERVLVCAGLVQGLIVYVPFSAHETNLNIGVCACTWLVGCLYFNSVL